MTGQPDEQRAEVSNDLCRTLREFAAEAGDNSFLSHREAMLDAAAQIAELEGENERLRRCLAGTLPPGEPAPLVGAEPVRCLACCNREQELAAFRAEVERMRAVVAAARPHVRSGGLFVHFEALREAVAALEKTGYYDRSDQAAGGEEKP